MIDDPSSADRGGIQVIARAAAILRALEGEPDGLSLGDLAERTSLARSTVQRIVGALLEEQFLVSAGPRSGVTLGPGLARLASSANVEVDRVARPIMQDLSRDLGETVDLSMMQGRTAVFVDQVTGAQRLVALSAVGEAFPLYCTANGKALLGCLPPDRRAALLPRALRRLTPSTTTDREGLLREIAAIGPQRVAFDMEEHSLGIRAAGVAFLDPLLRPFALSVPVPAERFEAKRADIIPRLLAARDLLIRGLPGGRLPP